MRVVLLASVLVAVTACASGPEALPPAQRLGNPVDEARTALARGDSTLLAVGDAPVEFPGTPEGFVSDAEPGYRMISAQSLGLSEREWVAQRDSLRVYAAAYNRLVLEARQGPVPAAP